MNQSCKYWSQTERWDHNSHGVEMSRPSMWFMATRTNRNRQTSQLHRASRVHQERKENPGIVSDIIIFRWPLQTKKIFWDRLNLTRSGRPLKNIAVMSSKRLCLWLHYPKLRCGGRWKGWGWIPERAKHTHAYIHKKEKRERKTYLTRNRSEKRINKDKMTNA